MIGILGGYGNIGKEIVKLLIQKGHTNLCIGSRTKQYLEKPEDQEVNSVLWQSVDIEQAHDLEQFMQSTDVIINAAGPSSRLTNRVAQCALRLGCHLIDCGSHQEVLKLVPIHLQQSLLFHVGAVPGLSDLLPYLFGSDFKQLQSCKHFYSITDAFTETAAIDFIDGIYSKQVPSSETIFLPTPELHDILPFFPRAKRVIGYERTQPFPLEAEPISIQWYSVIQGEHMDQFLKTAAKQWLTNKKSAASALSVATQLDHLLSAGGVTFLLELSGVNHDLRTVHHLYRLQADSQSKLSAAVAVAVYESLRNGDIQTGIGGSELLKYPERILTSLIQSGVIDLQVIRHATITESETCWI